MLMTKQKLIFSQSGNLLQKTADEYLDQTESESMIMLLLQIFSTL